MGTSVQVYNPEQQMSQDRIDLIKRTIAPNLKNDEFELFIARCNQTGLDPIARQIYALSVWDSQANEGRGGNKMSIQTSIDGLRLLAERSGKYEGQVGPFWCDESGEWRDVWVKDDKPPVAAKVGIYKAGFREPLYAVAHYRDFVKKHSKTGDILGQWKSMPAVMIAKVAESHAIRRAFPHETKGMYTREEMQQAMQDEDVIEGTVLHTEETHQDAPSNGNGHKPTNSSSKNGKTTPAQPQAQSQQPEAPTIEEIKTLCDTVYGPGNWARVKAMIFDPEKHGDLADEVMSQAQRAKAYGMLIARQKALAKADAAASAASSK